jgi:hypothetical protein
MDSWINPRPAVLLTISWSALVISVVSLEVKIWMIFAIGQA